MPTPPKKHRTYCKCCKDFTIHNWSNIFNLNKEESKLLCVRCNTQDSGYNINDVDPKLIELQRSRYKKMKLKEFERLLSIYGHHYNINNVETGMGYGVIECDAGQKEIDNLHKLKVAKEKQLQQEKHREFIDTYSKVNRNDKCPCGSNKKYKQCHLKEFK